MNAPFVRWACCLRSSLEIIIQTNQILLRHEKTLIYIVELSQVRIYTFCYFTSVKITGLNQNQATSMKTIKLFYHSNLQGNVFITSYLHLWRDFVIKFWSIYKHSLAFLSTWDVEETFINMSVYLWYNITIRSILFWNHENPLTQSCEGVTKLNVYFTNPNGELDMVN